MKLPSCFFPIVMTKNKGQRKVQHDMTTASQQELPPVLIISFTSSKLTQNS
jgi:hypothetical protein